jgi:hypothetical protein
MFLQLSNTKSEETYNISQLQVMKDGGGKVVGLVKGDSALYCPTLAELES